MKAKYLREIVWNYYGHCIYTTGHLDAQEFLNMVREFKEGDVPQEAKDALTADKVRHRRFRPILPSECFDENWAVTECERGGYPVTAIFWPSEDP